MQQQHPNQQPFIVAPLPFGGYPGGFQARPDGTHLEGTDAPPYQPPSVTSTEPRGSQSVYGGRMTMGPQQSQPSQPFSPPDLFEVPPPVAFQTDPSLLDFSPPQALRLSSGRSHAPTDSPSKSTRRSNARGSASHVTITHAIANRIHAELQDRITFEAQSALTFGASSENRTCVRESNLLTVALKVAEAQASATMRLLEAIDRSATKPQLLSIVSDISRATTAVLSAASESQIERGLAHRAADWGSADALNGVPRVSVGMGCQASLFDAAMAAVTEKLASMSKTSVQSIPFDSQAMDAKKVHHCPAPKRAEGRRVTALGSPNDICYNCNESGHRSPDCPNPKRKLRDSGSSGVRTRGNDRDGRDRRGRDRDRDRDQDGEPNTIPMITGEKEGVPKKS